MGGPVLVTGAAGFVGGAIVKRLALEGATVRAAVRRPVAHWDSKVESSSIIELAPDSDWRPAIAGIDAVVHCAARVHVMSESSIDPLAEFRRINVAGTLNLALQAVDAGVRRFVFVSSIASTVSRPSTSRSPPTTKQLHVHPTQSRNTKPNPRCAGWVATPRWKW